MLKPLVGGPVQLNGRFPDYTFMDPHAVLSFVRKLISKDHLPPLESVQVSELDTMLHTNVLVLSFHSRPTKSFPQELFMQAQAILSHGAADGVVYDGCGVLFNSDATLSTLQVAFYTSKQPFNQRTPIRPFRLLCLRTHSNPSHPSGATLPL